MQRRDFLHMMAIAGGVAACGFYPSIAHPEPNRNPERQQMIAAWRRRIESILARGRLPIIDTQATYISGKTNVKRMLDNMDELDVAQIAFAPANDLTAASVLELHRSHPEYFIPTTNSGEWNGWWDNPARFLLAVREQLQSGSFFFMGEHEFRHYPSPEQVQAGRNDRDITVDISGPAGQGLFQLGEEFGIAFQIHYEIEDRLLPDLESMLARYPRAKVIWCHLAMLRYPERSTIYGPAYVNSLIERFPGLHFDLAVPPPNSVYAPSGAHQSTLYTGSGLREDWKAVLEAHPDRFLAASDYRPPVEASYSKNIARQHELILGVLSERSRHLIAYQNAWRLMTGENWAG